MKILICGAGMVGASIARHLAREGNEVTLIDNNPEIIQSINSALDVRAFHGHASHPAMLEKAGAYEADMLIAVTHSDEVNMVACQIGYSLFSIPTRIARVRDQNYLNPVWQNLYSKDHMAIDFIISPEVEVAQTTLRRLHEPGTVDTIPFMNGHAKVIGMRCTEDCPFLKLPMPLVQQKTSHLNMRILGITRDGTFKIPTNKTMLYEGDVLYFVAPPETVRAAVSAFGHQERSAHRVIILGGGNIGFYLANALETEHAGEVRAKIIESNKARAEIISMRLGTTTVLHGDALNRDLMTEAGMESAETVIAVTNDDETNIIGSLLAKRFGCDRAITLVNNASYAPLLSNLGVDVVVNPRETTVSGILQHVRRGKICAVHTIADGMAEIIEAEAMDTSSVVGRAIGELELPKGVVIAALFRHGIMSIPDNEEVIHAGDRVLILANSETVRYVEKIFSVSLEYF